MSLDRRKLLLGATMTAVTAVSQPAEATIRKFRTVGSPAVVDLGTITFRPAAHHGPLIRCYLDWCARTSHVPFAARLRMTRLPPAERM